MDIMPISVVVFGAIPEAILMVWAGLLLLEQKPNAGKLLVVGIVQGIGAYYIRRYMPFGYHFILQTGVLVVLTYLVVKVRFLTALMAVAISSAVIILVEGSLMVFLNANIAYVLSMGWKRIYYILPHDLIFALIIYICKKNKVSLLKEFGVLRKFV